MIRSLPRSQLPSKLLVSGHPVTVDPRQLGFIMITIGIMMMIMKMVVMMVILMETYSGAG